MDPSEPAPGADDGEEIEETAAAEELAVAFARVLRGGGLSVPIGNVLTFGEGLAAVGLDDRDAVYWTARTTLVRRPEDLPFFDRAFAVFWELRRPGAEPPPEEVLHLTLALDAEDGEEEQDDGEAGTDEPTITLRFSAVETLRHKDFAAYSHDELHEAQRLMADLRLAGSPRRSRRMVKAKVGRRPHQGRPDLRRTVHAALRAGGEAISPRYREPGERLRRLVLLLDVSGSMEPYARALLRFVQAAVAGRQRVEAFALGTRLTRVTRELSSRDPGPRAGAGRRSGPGLVRRDPARRVPPAVQRPVGRARHGPRRHRRDPVGRVGPGRARGAGRADGRDSTAWPTGSCG